MNGRIPPAMVYTLCFAGMAAGMVLGGVVAMLFHPSWNELGMSCILVICLLLLVQSCYRQGLLDQPEQEGGDDD